MRAKCSKQKERTWHKKERTKERKIIGDFTRHQHFAVINGKQKSYSSLSCCRSSLAATMTEKEKDTHND